jgi:serine/threonine-protein kinase RsbW
MHVFGYDERDCFAVHLACEEALANALRHGTHHDPDKEVRLVSHVGPDGVRIEIEDDGPGFNPATVPDPTAPENLERESGRGLLLMRAYMDKVEFEDRGNRVVLVRRR